MKLMKANRYPRLDLELLRPGATQFRSSLLILAAGILLAMVAAVHYFHTVRQIAALETGMIQPSNMPADADAPPASEEAQAVQEGIARLDLPWGSLFAALESTAIDGVILLSVEPDADKRTIKIVAEAPEVYVMLEYLKDLARQPALKDVLLTEYEVGDDAAGQPVRFTLASSWVRVR